MARPIDFVHEEIVRVARALGKDPRKLKRSKFLPETDVTKHDLEHYGGFSKLRSDAAHVLGVSPHKDTAESRGV